MKQFALALLLLPVAIATDQFAITHVTAVDATEAPVRSDTTVVVNGERISSIGPSGSSKILAGAHIVDESGKFLIPGLWDLHAHTAYTAWLAGSRETFPPLLVANGVTGIRDVGGLEELQDRRRDMAAGRLLGPRIFASRPMLDGPVLTYSWLDWYRNGGGRRANGTDFEKRCGADCGWHSRGPVYALCPLPRRSTQWGIKREEVRE